MFTDSQAALIAIRDRLLSTLGHTHARLVGNGAAIAGRLVVLIRFAWAPSHAGIMGNETADEVARAIVALPVTASGEYFVGEVCEICHRDSAD